MSNAVYVLQAPLLGASARGELSLKRWVRGALRLGLPSVDSCELKRVVRVCPRTGEAEARPASPDEREAAQVDKRAVESLFVRGWRRGIAVYELI